MGRRKIESTGQAIENLYRIYINLIYAALICILLLFGYIVLRSEIHDFLNRKVYTKEELAMIRKSAEARQREQLVEKNWDLVVDGIHVRTGLHDDESLELIIGTCTSCHSAKMITQNKATREGWHSMITWMQKTQGLADLGKNEPTVLDYLEKYYAPMETGRRKTLDVNEIEWYMLEL